MKAICHIRSSGLVCNTEAYPSTGSIAQNAAGPTRGVHVSIHAAQNDRLWRLLDLPTGCHVHVHQLGSPHSIILSVGLQWAAIAIACRDLARIGNAIACTQPTELITSHLLSAVQLIISVIVYITFFWIEIQLCGYHPARQWL